MTILFGIGTPLCALACVDAPSGHAAVAQMNSDSVPPAPCHGLPSTPAPDAAPESHSDCGCDFSIDGLLPDSANDVSLSLVGWTGSRSVADIVVASKRAAINRRVEPDTKVSDILLLKSTLLI